MNCTYTAQGTVICRKEKNIEQFIVNENPNEKEIKCPIIGQGFSSIANKYACDMTSDMDQCSFSFKCKSAKK